MTRIIRDVAAHRVQSSAGSAVREISNSHLSRRSTPRIAIIGAGFAGLRCADLLIRSGADVTVLEARNRIGGRVHQARNDGHLVDMGPNWIHGSKGNPIQDIAQKTNGVLFNPDGRQIIFDSNGRRKPLQESTELGAEFWAMVINAFKYSDENHSKINVKESLMDFFRTELAERFPKDHAKVKDILDEATMWGFFVGDSIEAQSLRCFSLEETLEGETGFLASTYAPILSEVQDAVLKGAKVMLNEEIVSIRYRKEAEKSKQVFLTNKTGQTSAFDEVVVTCPLGWLKRNKASFEPSLPRRMVEAIDNIGYGRLEKLFITFNSAFWYKDTVKHSESQDSIAADDQEITPILTHFQNPSYHPDPASKGSSTWNQCVMSMAHLPGSTSHPTLLIYLYGDCGRHLTSLVASHEKHSTEYNRLLEEFALPFISKMPNYDSTNKDCRPTSYLLTSWQTDPFAGYGSYSNFQVGLEEGAADVETMRDAGGLSDEGRGIWFAGEHTAPFVALGTTTGAYWSGEAIAKRIVKAYGLNGASIDNESQQ